MKKNIKLSLILTASLSILFLVACSKKGMGVNSEVGRIPIALVNANQSSVLLRAAGSDATSSSGTRTVTRNISALAFKSVTMDIFNSPMFESETP